MSDLGRLFQEWLPKLKLGPLQMDDRPCVVKIGIRHVTLEDRRSSDSGVLQRSMEFATHVLSNARPNALRGARRISICINSSRELVERSKSQLERYGVAKLGAVAELDRAY